MPNLDRRRALLTFGAAAGLAAIGAPAWARNLDVWEPRAASASGRAAEPPRLLGRRRLGRRVRLDRSHAGGGRIVLDLLLLRRDLDRRRGRRRRDFDLRLGR